MTKKEIQDRAKETVAKELGLNRLDGRVDSFTWVLDAGDSQVKVTLTALKDKINIDEAVAEWGVRRDAREAKKKE